MRRKWRWMGCFEDEVFSGIDQGFFGVREATSEEKDQMIVLIRQTLNYAISELFSSEFVMRSGFVCFYGKDCIE